MKTIMLSCKKATELVEKRNFIPLSFKEKFQLKMHLGMCKSCSAFQKESYLFDQAFEKLTKNEDIKLNNSSPDLKNRIIENLINDGDR